MNKKEELTDKDYMAYLYKPFKTIKFDELFINSAKNGNQLLQIRFEDSLGKAYLWTPKWQDLCYIFEKSIMVENWNMGEHWIDLAKSAMSVIAHLLNLLHRDHKKLPGSANIDKETDVIEVKRGRGRFA